METIRSDGNDVVLKEVYGGRDVVWRALQLDRSICACINDHGHKRPAK